MAVHPGLDLFFTASCETVNVIGLIDLVYLDGSCDDASSDAGSALEAIAVDVPLVMGPSSIVSTPNRGFSAATSAFDAKPDELRIEVGPESTRLFIVPERFGEIALFLASFTFVHAGPGVATSKQPRPKRGR